MTPMPQPCQLNRSLCTCSSTGSGSRAGPAEKLSTRSPALIFRSLPFDSSIRRVGSGNERVLFFFCSLFSFSSINNRCNQCKQTDRHTHTQTDTHTQWRRKHASGRGRDPLDLLVIQRRLQLLVLGNLNKTNGEQKQNNDQACATLSTAEIVHLEHRERERQRETERERERQRDRERERDRQRETERQRDRQRQAHTRTHTCTLTFRAAFAKSSSKTYVRSALRANMPGRHMAA